MELIFDNWLERGRLPIIKNPEVVTMNVIVFNALGEEQARIGVIVAIVAASREI